MGCPACRYMPTRADLPDGGETNKTMISLGGRAGVGAIQGKCGAPLGLGSCQAPPPRHESNARKPRCSSPDGRPMAPRSTATHRPAQNTLHRLVQQRAASFVEQTEGAVRADLTQFVKDKFDACLECEQ